MKTHHNNFKYIPDENNRAKLNNLRKINIITDHSMVTQSHEAYCFL